MNPVSDPTCDDAELVDPDVATDDEPPMEVEHIEEEVRDEPLDVEPKLEILLGMVFVEESDDIVDDAKSNEVGEAPLVNVVADTVADEADWLKLVDAANEVLEVLIASRTYTASRSVPPHVSCAFPAHGVTHWFGSLGLTGTLSGGSVLPQKPIVDRASETDLKVRASLVSTYTDCRLSVP